MKNSVKYPQLLSHCVDTRRAVSQCTVVPRMFFTAAQRDVKFIGPKLYNMLPINIRLIRSIRGFMSRVLEWIETNYELIIHELNLFT